METKKFNELLKTTNIEKIIRMHYSLKITLSEKQIEKVLKMKSEKEKRSWKN